MDKYYENCLLCPRACGVDRLAGQKGFCGETAVMRIACACLHFGEEPCLTNEGGSGTIFFSGCTLKCVSCQNNQLSHEGLGREVSSQELASIFLKLAEAGAQNINLVTGTHFIPGISKALTLARKEGFALPLVWNSSGYEEPAVVPLLNPLIDVYLVDIKTLDPEVARTALRSKNYAEKIRAVLPLMLEGHDCRYSATGAMTRGVIVRHLVLPGELRATYEVLKWFKDHLNGQALLSLMFQYVPKTDEQSSAANIINTSVPTALDRKVNKKEYEQVMDWLYELDIEDGFAQDYNPDSSWLPDFTKSQPFSSALSRTVWHYNDKKGTEV